VAQRLELDDLLGPFQAKPFYDPPSHAGSAHKQLPAPAGMFPPAGPWLPALHMPPKPVLDAGREHAADEVSVGPQVPKLRHYELRLNGPTHSCMGVPASSYATLSALSHVEKRCWTKYGR